MSYSAWRIGSICIRSAVTMGLNLRSEASTVSHISKETRYRVWWSIYMLDISLSVITGRPPNTADNHCTTPLPVPFLEENFEDETVAQLILDTEARRMLLESLTVKGSATPRPSKVTLPERDMARFRVEGPEDVSSNAFNALKPNMSRYFLHMVELSLVLRASVDKLYAPNTAHNLWHEIEVEISILNEKLDAWVTRLPTAFHFTNGTRPFKPQQMDLAFRFYSARIVITQPCLHRLTQHGPGMSIHGSFCDMMAQSCVNTAIQMLDLLPDLLDTSLFELVTPWWFALHYIMQATAVLLTELVVLGKKGTIRYNRALGTLLKANRWLAQVSIDNPSFQRARVICKEMITLITADFDGEAPPIFES